MHKELFGFEKDFLRLPRRPSDNNLAAAAAVVGGVTHHPNRPRIRGWKDLASLKIKLGNDVLLSVSGLGVVACCCCCCCSG
jgi:hypothetical protein